MIVLISEQIPHRLYGWLTQHVREVQPNVFVGVVSARVRAQMIDTITRELRSALGGVTVVVLQAGGQLDIRTLGQTTYRVADFDGLPLMVRPVHDWDNAGIDKEPSVR